MNNIKQVVLIGAGLFVSLNLLHAQTAMVGSINNDLAPVQSAAPDSIVCATAEAQGLSLISYDNLPLCGTYWEVLPNGLMPPLPCPPSDTTLPIYAITGNIFLVDATGGQVAVKPRRLGLQTTQATSSAVNSALESLATAIVNLIAMVQSPPVPLAPAPMMRMSMLSSSLATSYAYGNPVYLANLTTSFAYDGSATANFSIGGGTNFVPYDILTTTNLAAPVANWNWLGLGYTSNRYTFSNQPADHAFYILAKPAKTMTVVWGDDYYGQCDIPAGTTNILQVAGGDGHSLALLNNGKVMAWGANFYGQTNVPATLAGVTMIASGWYHCVALLTNGTVTAWGLNGAMLGWHLTEVPANLTNVMVISAQALHTLALRKDGTVVAWGYNSGVGEASVPGGLTNVTAISAGVDHNLAVTNGGVTAWGGNYYGQCNVPLGLSNVVDVAAGCYHSLALLGNGTVVGWGDNAEGAALVPAGLSNVVAIAAGGNPDDDTAYSLALKSDGTVVLWGYDEAANPLGGLNNVINIAAGTDYGLAVRTGPPTPVITLEPVSQFKAAGSTASFTVIGQGLYGVTYQWQTNGVNLSGATNTALTLTNVQMAQQAAYRAVVTDVAGNGSIVSSNANLYLVTPPVITYQSQPTNIVCIYGNHVALAATATAPGQFNGFPLSYQWKLNGTNISGATSNAYDFYATDASTGTFSLVVANAAGSTSASWQVALTNAINVTNDLLLIYNANSADSSNLCAYYLAHRPMVGGANVLGVACDTGEFFAVSNNLNTQLVTPVLNWLTNNPTKRPQYVVLFYDIPTRLWVSGEWGCGEPIYGGSVSYQLRNAYSGWQPFVNNINAGSLVDCEAYVDKLVAFGSNSPGQLIISTSAANYGNTNYILDNIRTGAGYPLDYTIYGYAVSNAISSLAASGVSPSAIIYANGLDTLTTIITNGVTNTIPYNAPQIMRATNVAAYICWGEHSALGQTYAIDTTVEWSGNSGGWIIETIESFNGMRGGCAQGNFIQWFSSNAFGGTNYSNTPIGAVSSVEEPYAIGACNPQTYLGLWAAGKNLAICAWNSQQTHYLQVIGDPFATR